MWRYVHSQYLRGSGLKLIKIVDKNGDEMTEYVSELRHYIKIGMLSVQTPLSTPSKLKLIRKLF